MTIKANTGSNQLLKSERTEETVTTVTQVNVARAAIYSFLSRAFRLEVDEKFLEAIVAIEPTIRSLCDSQGGEGIRELEDGSRELHEFAVQVGGLSVDRKKALLEDLAVEYANLFLAIGIKHVYSAESVYLGKEHLLYGAPYHEVLEAYKSLGFEREKGLHEPEDHVAVELEFMANLCRWTAQTIERKDVENTIAYLNLQKEFLGDHILRWVPDLCHKLDDAATKVLYKALAHLTVGFITIDNEIPDRMTAILKDAFSVEIRKMKIDEDSSVTYYS